MFLNIGKIHFAGHQTFPLRHTWLPKVVAMVKEDPNSLINELITMEKLGVGKNMAKAVKHWAESSVVVQKQDKQNSYLVTYIGETVFSTDGDQYIEKKDTIWLFHYLITSNPNKNALWFYLFNIYTSDIIDRLIFIEKIRNWCAENDFPIPTSNTLEKDFNCCMNMYSINPNKENNYNIENILASPFKELRLIYDLTKSGQYAIRSLNTKEFSSELFSFCMLDYLDKLQFPGSITIEQLLYEPFSPGRIFRLNESLLVDYLFDFQKLTNNKYIFDSTAGIKQLLKNSENEVYKKAWLKRIFS